jgi:DNA (cytosine-5)-methyltransferase 1
VRRLKAIDLFSGCGGLTLGLKKAGFRVIGAVEIDSVAVETYKSNHRRVVVWEQDLSRLPVAVVMRKLKLRPGQLDLLAGCPPCEGFSTLRTLNGHRPVDDPRNELLFEFMRFVRVLRPKAVMLENVPALAKDRRMTRALKELAALGYHCSWSILNTADYGVPQRRKRLLLLAGRRGIIPFAEPVRRKRTVREVIGTMKHSSAGDSLQDYTENRTERIKKIIKLIPKDGGSRHALADKEQLKCHKDCSGFNDIYGRMAWDNVAPTITSGFFNPSKGRFLHPTKNRAITLREGALLQTFPRSYSFSLRRGRSHTAEMIGNALPPEFVRRHAAMIHRFLISRLH